VECKKSEGSTTTTVADSYCSGTKPATGDSTACSTALCGTTNYLTGTSCNTQSCGTCKDDLTDSDIASPGANLCAAGAFTIGTLNTTQGTVSWTCGTTPCQYQLCKYVNGKTQYTPSASDA
jgi:hypothetical protein